jgi:ferredoxin-NADP reductase
VYYLPGPRAAENSWAPAGYGRDDRLLRELVPGIARQDVFVCGPDPWMAAVAEAARRAGVPDEHLHIESFRW